MPRISDRCQPGAWGNLGGWLPVCAWPDDCYVQWGDKGVVGTAKGSYITAFFESFPPGTFIRGEGLHVAAAEQDAWKQYERILACPAHEFERRGYTNGMGFCKHCGMSSSKAFPEQEQVVRVHASEITDEELKQGLDEVFRHFSSRITEEGKRVEPP